MNLFAWWRQHEQQLLAGGRHGTHPFFRSPVELIRDLWKRHTSISQRTDFARGPRDIAGKIRHCQLPPDGPFSGFKNGAGMSHRNPSADLCWPKLVVGTIGGGLSHQLLKLTRMDPIYSLCH